MATATLVATSAGCDGGVRAGPRAFHTVEDNGRWNFRAPLGGRGHQRVLDACLSPVPSKREELECRIL
ncbi:unnamed protein product [Urochloa humidicola]